MDFSKALEALKEGKQVRLHGHALYFSSSGDEVTLSYNSLVSDDWEVMEGIPEVKLRIKEYFTCPSCKHENIGFHLDNGISTCEKCGQKVKTLPRCERQMNNLQDTTSQKLRKWLEITVKDFDYTIKGYVNEKQYQRAGNFDKSRECFQTCLDMLNKYEQE